MCCERRRGNAQAHACERRRWAGRTFGSLLPRRRMAPGLRSCWWSSLCWTVTPWRFRCKSRTRKLRREGGREGETRVRLGATTPPNAGQALKRGALHPVLSESLFSFRAETSGRDSRALEIHTPAPAFPCACPGRRSAFPRSVYTSRLRLRGRRFSLALRRSLQGGPAVSQGNGCVDQSGGVRVWEATLESCRGFRRVSTEREGRDCGC